MMDDITRQLSQFSKVSKEKQNYLEELRKQTPYDSIRSTFQKEVEREEKYRVSVLRNVATFAKLNPQFLLSAAQNMEEIILPRGTVIIRQDDVGDSFYVIQEGEVLVTRVANPSEPPKELAKLGKNSYIGEIALMTQEPRTATVTVISAQAKILKMTKAKFDEVMAASNAALFNDKKEFGKEVVDKVPLFQSLTAAKKKMVVDCMRPMSFLPNTYICRQGQKGNTFYIITEGTCKVCVNMNGAENEVARLKPGDFFGEVALIEPSNKRTADVISLSAVTCMTLSRADFTNLLSNVRNSLMENSLLRSLALRKLKKESKGKTGKRRISILGENNQKSDILVPEYIKRLLRAMTESLYVSLYARMYREMLLKPDSAEQYGELAKAVMIMHHSRESAVNAIMTQIQAIGKTDPNERTTAEHNFMYGLLMQKNALRDKACKGWPSYQFKLLSRHVKVVKYKPLSKIIESGAIGTSAYLILRGMVRIFSNSAVEGSHKVSQKYEEDLFSGEIFADAALDGIRTRLVTAQAITACDLLVLEYKDYAGAKVENGQKESVDDRFQFLSKSSLLKHMDGIDLYKLASAMNREELTKGSVVLRKGEITKKLSFLKEGKVDIVVGLGQTQIQHIITTLTPQECFGESGLLSSSNFISDKSEDLRESCYAVVGNYAVLLTLPEQHYNLLDQGTVERLMLSFREKSSWRVHRLRSLINETKNIHKIKKKMSSVNIEHKEEAPDEKPKVEEIDLNNIPSMIDGDLDPLLAISTCRNSREVRKVQNAIKETKRPNSAKPTLRKNTMDHLKGNIDYRRKTHNSGASRNNDGWTSTEATKFVENLKTPLPSLNLKMINTKALLPEIKAEGQEFWMKTPEEYLKTPSNLLLGTARIPSPKSYNAQYDIQKSFSSLNPKFK